jgi:type IV secretory pathway VirJ component
VPRLLAALLALCLIPSSHAAVDSTRAANPPRRAPAAHPARPKTPPPRDAQVERWLHVAAFGEVAVYKPAGESRGLALFASGDGGWARGVTEMAHQAAAQGFWVAGFSTPLFLEALADVEGACSDVDGLLARLGADLVRELRLPADTRPVLIGYSSGATLVYAALAADAGRRFGGGISLGFCPDLPIRKAFCPGRGGLTAHWQKRPPTWIFDKRATVEAPWRILQGEADQVCDPAFAPQFAAGQRDAAAIMLPKVGHGFGVPKNWMPQYVRSVQELAGAQAR